MVIIIQIIDGVYLYYFKMMICDYFDLNLSRVMWHFKARYVSINILEVPQCSKSHRKNHVKHETFAQTKSSRNTL
jgi:hypothetical protein